MSRPGSQLVLSLALLVACARATAPATYPRDAVPAEIEPRVQAAEAAMNDLQARLAQRLLEEIGRAGLVAAVTVCRDEAQRITAAAASERGIEVGRTSHRLRNPANAPRPWVRAFVQEAAGRKASDFAARVVDLGDRVGVVRPIGVQGLCLGCHGAAEGLPPELRRALADAYPDDRATGFAEGDLRGLFWAEARK